MCKFILSVYVCIYSRHYILIFGISMHSYVYVHLQGIIRILTTESDYYGRIRHRFLFLDCVSGALCCAAANIYLDIIICDKADFDEPPRFYYHTVYRHCG